MVWPNYAEGPFRFYFQGLPADATVPVRPGSDLGAIGTRLNGAPARAGQRAARQRLFLVTRVDLVTARYARTFDRLVAEIGARPKQFAEIETLSITADTSLVPEPLATATQMSAVMDAAFGPPAHVDSRAGYERRVYR